MSICMQQKKAPPRVSLQLLIFCRVKWVDYNYLIDFEFSSDFLKRAMLSQGFCPQPPLTCLKQHLTFVGTAQPRRQHRRRVVHNFYVYCMEQPKTRYLQIVIGRQMKCQCGYCRYPFDTGRYFGTAWLAENLSVKIYLLFAFVDS